MGSQLRYSSRRMVDIESAALGSSVEKPMFRIYVAESRRLETFANWSDSILIDKNDLVEAGFFYTKNGDTVRCYFCGVCLNNWEPDDVPMAEHVRWSPKCYHVLLAKGQKYIDKIIMGDENGDVSNGKEAAGACGGTDIVAKDACLEMGFSGKDIERAVAVYKEEHGNSDDYNTVQLCETLINLNSDSSDEEDSISEQNCGSQEAKDDTEDKEKRLIDDQLREEYLCKICMDEKMIMVFIPCGHLISCFLCASVLSVCPVCRQTITSTVKVVF
ncbi:baculoviral IAP repeat-containing protein 2-like [Ruditapes philippinarum]|uniref:baculoviral IAP repeat-containing protein 2-like n=1 Tax=Ruditapes philippinarum TaxID=129788 RepID=UPI00295C2F43|nr:baculoviral IAP repeat-containing protein 2-like [Ruditapes philippinarum]XP_060582185.1 baculoviral IAP repeat-containing protein 2-like [Ruditapes philippinarum]